MEPTTQRNDEILKLTEAAAVLQITPKTLYKLLAAKRIPARRVGGQWRISRAALMKWLGAPNGKVG